MNALEQLRAWLLAPLDKPRDALSHWRQRVFKVVFGFSLILGLLPLGLSLHRSWADGLHFNLVAYALGYVVLLLVVLAPRLSFHVRAGLGVMVYVAYGFISLATVGPAGSGRLMLFTAAALAALFLGFRAGAVIIGITCVAQLFLDWQLGHGWMPWSKDVLYSVPVWRTTGSTLIFLMCLITLATTFIMRGMRGLLREQEQMVERLTRTQHELTEEVQLRGAAQERLQQMQRNLENLVAERTRELAHSEERFRAFMDHTPAAVFILDQDCRYVYANRTHLDSTGVDQEDLLGAGLEEVFEPESAQDLWKMARGVLRDSGVWRGQHWLCQRGSVPAYWELIAFVLPNKQGQGLLAAIGLDITERRRVEENLAQMASGVAHNFNNLLMALASNAQAAVDLMEQDDRRGEARELMGTVVQTALAGKGMARRLGAVAEAKNPSAHHDQLVDMGELVHTALQVARSSHFWSDTPPVRAHTDLEPGLVVRGSRGELLEVLMNLLKNAVEAQPQGGLVSISLRRWGLGLCLEVWDRGLGVDPAAMPHLFRPFFSTKGSRGRGLGLASSLGIVRAHGGDLQIFSHPGQGAIARVELPVISAQALVAAGQNPELPAECRVMLVEDEALVAMGLCRMLEAQGCRVRLARNLAEVGRALGEEEFQVVLCDFGLPDGDGWDVSALLQEEAVRRGKPRLPLVFLTGRTRSQLYETRRPGLLMPSGILQKPVEKSELMAGLCQAIFACANA